MRERQSNIELLRLVCMFFIVIHHIIEHALPAVPALSVDNNLIIRTMDVFAFCAVPVFVLISGYFGINVKVKGLLNFYIQCAFYSGLIYLIHVLICDMSIGRTLIYSTFFPITMHRELWFLECYFMLYLVSPLLNKCIDNLSKREFHIALVILVVVNLWYGWFWQRASSNDDGFNLYNFVFLYFIGRYIAKYVELSKISYIRSKTILMYISGSILLSLLPLINSHIGLLEESSPVLNYFAYNHPLLIINSIAVLLLFLSFNFQNRIINWLATSTLSVYLIHENGYIRDYWYRIASKLCDLPTVSEWNLGYIMILLIALVVLFVCLMIDKLRIPITKPIVQYLSMKINNLIDRQK